MHECGAPCNWMVEGKCYRWEMMALWMEERFIVFWMGMEVGGATVVGCLLVWSWDVVHWGRRNTVANCGYYFCDLFIKIECIQLFFDVSMVIV